MQRALIIIAMVGLVIAAFAAGALAAHWPYWQRAWQWHVAQHGTLMQMPASLPGPTGTLQPAATPMPLDISPDAQLDAFARGTGTSLLLVADHDGRTRAYSASPGDKAGDTLIDGRGLASGLPVLLYGALIQQGRANLLDEPVEMLLAQWREDPRGAITPRQLFWQLSGLSGGPFRPLDPFSPLSQLASGPDFQRAALRSALRYPPGSHYAASPANAQLLALVASRLTGVGHAAGLERFLWARVASLPATGMLDRPRGEMAAHCCFTASAGDWLRMGLLLANHGRSGDLQVLPSDYVDEVATASPVNPGLGLGFEILAGDGGQQLLQLATGGRRLLVAPGTGAALFWVGTGEPPAGLAALLLQGQGSRVQ